MFLARTKANIYPDGRTPEHFIKFKALWNRCVADLLLRYRQLGEIDLYHARRLALGPSTRRSDQIRSTRRSLPMLPHLLLIRARPTPERQALDFHGGLAPIYIEASGLPPIPVALTLHNALYQVVMPPPPLLSHQCFNLSSPLSSPLSSLLSPILSPLSSCLSPTIPHRISSALSLYQGSLMETLDDRSWEKVENLLQLRGARGFTQFEGDCKPPLYSWGPVPPRLADRSASRLPLLTRLPFLRPHAGAVNMLHATVSYIRHHQRGAGIVGVSHQYGAQVGAEIALFRRPACSKWLAVVPEPPI